MNVTCPNCATVYRVDPLKVPEAGVRARCTICSAVFAVNRDGDPAARATAVPSAASAPAAAGP
ncbi:MAG: zinc-ribbon domain-containing protein, partial [Gemmatimonadales bacterium]